MLRKISNNLFKAFCSQIQSTTKSNIIEQPQKNQLPVHLRPYNKAKYQQIMTKIKLNSGYAFLQVQPFPRAKIMKTCYHILQQLNIQFPKNSMYRIFSEQRTKYIMKIVDETQDVQQLQDIFGVQTIQLFIDNLVGQLQTINHLRFIKVWEKQQNDSIDNIFMQGFKPEQAIKNPAYKKSQRPKTVFTQ